MDTPTFRIPVEQMRVEFLGIHIPDDLCKCRFPHEVYTQHVTDLVDESGQVLKQEFIIHRSGLN